MKTFFIFIGFVVFLSVVFFLPFDWWQKAPSRQKERIIGKVLPFLDISIRNIVLRGLVLIYLLFLYVNLIIFLPFLIAFIVTALVLWSLHEHICLRKRDLPVPLTGLVIIFLLAALFAVGLGAPLRIIPVVGYLALGRPAGNSWEMLTIGKGWMTFDAIIGLAGLFGVASWMLLDAVWRLRQYRQVANTATSKIGALALGLVEVKGAVIRLSDEEGNRDAIEISYGMSDAFKPRQTIDRFLLDDGTGSVIVDARTCRVRAGWIAEISAIFGVREVVLRRRKVRDEFNDAITRTLQYGDRIYVIGSAERERGDDIVIRPASRSGWNEVLWKTLFGVIKPPKDRDIHDVFFLTDGDETVAQKHIMKGFRTVLLFGLIWIAASAAIIWMSQQSWRQAPPPDSWRNAYWRGPDPDPDPRVVDTTRNKRLFRFEKYIKTVGPGSYNEIPALLEALAYKDFRFRDGAARVLLRMLPAARREARAAVPLLAKHLSDSPAASVQTYILALGAFGPLAEQAVPALIEQLRNRGPFPTYEVTTDIIRFQAARALGAIGPAARDAIPELMEALNDPSSLVRDAAQDALRRM